MSITFAESHVDLMGNVTFTSQQLANRWEWELEKKWSRVTQDNLRDFMQIKDIVDANTFPSYAENVSMLGQFIIDKQTCYTRRVADEARNALLKSVLIHECLIREKSDIELILSSPVGAESVSDVDITLDQEARLAEIISLIASADASVIDLVQSRRG